MTFLTDHTRGYRHHQRKVRTSSIREAIFGMEDGMVSTLGALTGIAGAVNDHFVVVVSGFVVVTVEAISMAVGSFLSTKSETDIETATLDEETDQLRHFPEEEKQELLGMYLADSWPPELASQMVEAAAQNPKLFLHEMALHELEILPHRVESPVRNGVIMGAAYILGGSIPLLPYLLFTIKTAFPVSIAFTLTSLFVVGALTTLFSRRVWWKAGLEMLGLASVAAALGYAAGQLVERFVL